MSTLDREIKTYESNLPKLLAKQGKYVLIHGDDVVGTFDSYEDALNSGYERFALVPFLVKQIAPAERIAFFTRDLGFVCQA